TGPKVTPSPLDESQPEDRRAAMSAAADGPLAKALKVGAAAPAGSPGAASKAPAGSLETVLSPHGKQQAAKMAKLPKAPPLKATAKAVPKAANAPPTPAAAAAAPAPATAQPEPAAGAAAPGSPGEPLPQLAAAPAAAAKGQAALAPAAEDQAAPAAEVEGAAAGSLEDVIMQPADGAPITPAAAAVEAEEVTGTATPLGPAAQSPCASILGNAALGSGPCTPLSSSFSDGASAMIAGGPEMSPRQCQEFNCSKCKQDLSVMMLAPKCKKPGNKSSKVCSVCVACYGKLQRRWAKNSRLKTWWEAKTEDEQTQWYLECFENNSGNESGGELKIELEVVEKDEENQRKQYMWKPWKQYKKDLFMEGFTEEKDQLIEWRKRLQDKDYKKWYTANEWHIGEYLGILDEGVKSKAVVSRQRKKSSGFDGVDDAAAKLEQQQEDYNRIASGLKAAWPGHQHHKPESGPAANIPEEWVQGAVGADGDLQERDSLPNLLSDTVTEMAEQREIEVTRELQEEMQAQAFPEKKKEVDIRAAKMDMQNATEKSKAKLKSMVETLDLEAKGTIATIKERLFPKGAAVDELFLGLLAEWDSAWGEVKTELEAYSGEHDAILSAANDAQPGFNFQAEKAKVKAMSGTFSRAGGPFKKAKKACSALQAALSKRLTTSTGGGGGSSKKMKLAMDKDCVAPPTQLDESHLSAAMAVWCNVKGAPVNMNNTLSLAAPGAPVLHAASEVLSLLQAEKSYGECRKFVENTAKEMAGKQYWTVKECRRRTCA
ncbi:unnamed protein product, partial [Prorocentrum cordatum]